MVVYKTINLINGKIYIGQDRNNNPAYIGSGKLINRAIKKYGKENFRKEIIEICDSKQHLNEREIYWINYYSSTDVLIGYNIAIGGQGGNLGKKVNKKISDSLKGIVFSKNRNIKISNTRKQLSKEGKLPDVRGSKNGMYGKHLKEESKCTLEGFILRYGEEEGTKRYNSYTKNISIKRKGKCNFVTNLKGFIDKYGKEIGTMKYNNWLEKTRRTKKNNNSEVL